DVGVSVVDTTLGRVLVSPSKAFDGEWISTFVPGVPIAIAAAVGQCRGQPLDGPWFPEQVVTRDFDTSQREEKCQSRL
ncbi:ESX secretion-associated protein EspG, partial [Mycobacterium sp. ITM-2017-0098]